MPPPFSIKNFKYGLDTRRDILTSQPGTFVTLENAYVNQGAEIEQRKAFFPTALPSNTFGLQGTALGVYVFGSDADPGGWPRGQFAGYQRLQHPAVLAGAAYNATYHAMTGVRWSYSYKGFALVAATFADGHSFLYYNGTIVNESMNGLMHAGFANNLAINTFIANQITANVNTITGWFSATFAASNLNWANATADARASRIYSPATLTFSLIITKVSTNGVLVDRNISTTGLAAGPGTASTASFTVAGGAGNTYDVSGPVSAGSTVRIPLCTTIAWGVNNNTTATAIAAAITAATDASGGYTAAAVGAVVTVSAPIPVGGISAQPYNQGTLVVVSADGTANGNHAFGAGTSSNLASGQIRELLIDSTWVAGDTWSIEVVTTANNYTVGAGAIEALATMSSPYNGYVLGERVFVTAGLSFSFSEVGDPTAWEQQNAGAGTVPFASQYGQVDLVQAFAAYQGFLAVIGRRTVQIWETDANPAQFSRRQILPNIGTPAMFSVQPVGQLDVYFAADSGVRSLRVRDSSNNAFVTDIGTPIDSLIVADLATFASGVRSTIEPLSNQYWLYLHNKIYVLSNYPSLDIASWSTFIPSYVATVQFTITAGTSGSVGLTYLSGTGALTVPFHTNLSTTAADLVTLINVTGGGVIATAVGAVITVFPAYLLGAGTIGVFASGTMAATIVRTTATFAPVAFTIYNGQVFCRDGDALGFSYGGLTGTAYDGSVVTLELPWLDDGTPTQRKTFKSVDTVMSGKWAITGGVSPDPGTLQAVFSNGAANGSIVADSTCDDGVIPFVGHGTHFKVKLVSHGDNNLQVKLGALAVNYTNGEVK